MKKSLFGLLFVAVLGGVPVWSGLRLSQSVMRISTGNVQAAASLDEPAPAPEFPKHTQWVQSPPLKLGELHGQVVILHFWTFGCINCIHNFPVYRSWQEKYAGKGVTIIGVHTPEFAHEADATRVQAKARDNGLKFPIAIDNDHVIWKSWDNHYWPSINLIDKNGRVRYHWDGELHPETSAGRQFISRIDELLAEPIGRK